MNAELQFPILILMQAELRIQIPIIKAQLGILIPRIT
jgi:hypothetical protein